MAYNFISCSDGSFLPRQDLRGWLPPQHLCWQVLKVVGELDLSEFLRSYRADGQGAAAYPPQVLLALVLYCYCKGVRSSRRIEAACLDDVGCRIITGNQHIDHATVARFLRRHRDGMKALFVQVLALCAQRGLVDLAAVAVDGSPMQAAAARSTNRSLHALETMIADGEAEVDQLMGDMDAPAAAEDSTWHTAAGSCLRRLSRLGDRLARARMARDKLHERVLPSAGEIRIKVEAAERMVARAVQRLADVTAAQQQRLADYARRSLQDQAAGRRRATGRPPVAIEAKTKVVRQQARLARAQAGLHHALNPRPIPSAAARASLTDPASRLMLGKHGGYVQGYNVQIACSRNQILLAIELHDNPSDTTALVPVIRRAQHNCATAGLTADVEAWLADSGYASTANFTALADLPLLVSLTKEYDQTRATTPRSQDVPAGHRDMAARLASTEGKQLYARRGALVEPGFAQLFQRFGRRLHHRGTSDVDAEIKLLGIVHNLNKIFRHDARPKAA
ncbi:Transposase [Micromonospora pallida]|uniref:Transposase n=1 Tax=Micromonospora pallida TaxID=145854 RepID=A0A1C6T2S1_9ACTN|nr:transposase [Micromonospora pallida]SCL19893.1 Transposase [Micromonospora pallida]SCL36106.1 Transposase [Micromonospora pallida]SCL41690.1 Transposase [Micromonospora pallida]